MVPTYNRSSYESSVNGDMWRQYYEYSDQANGTRIRHGLSTLEIRKVKAHRTAVQAARDGDFLLS